MARFLTRPGPPPPKDENSWDDESFDFLDENGHVEMDSDPSELLEIEELEYEDTIDPKTLGTATDDEIIEDVCMDWWIYAKPIEVYQCLQPPEKLAWDIFLWERLENIGIDQCIDVHPASPCQPETNIPPEAIYVMVGDTIAQNPYGHCALFCRRVLSLKTNAPKYIPLTGFFWSFISSNSTTVQSLSEYFHSRAAPSQLVTLYERIHCQDEVRFPEMFNMITETVNWEMHLLKMNRRTLRNIMGTNRTKPTRWRSMIGRDPPVE
ncbi:hypothetical protein E2P81_ATG07368 [Venturia nashicola]|nr:hypothetical protein E2P81_ATG07368 [Venturia nashicola]